MNRSDEPPPLAPGLRHTERLVVAPRHAVPHVASDWPGFEDMPPVFATAMMVGFMEQTCIQALRPYLAPGQHTVGTHVDVSHVAATPLGMTVTADVELVSVEGRTLLFKVACGDEAGIIGEGVHRRAIVDARRFLARVDDKARTWRSAEPRWRLRDPRPGDIGWVVHRHGVLYAQEYGWSAEFEALVAEIVGRFVREFDPRCERCWIAEMDGRVVGSVFAVRHDADTAKLRVLYVEPDARGLGIGHRLVDACVRFAREAGYRKMLLWTDSQLLAARRIYEQAGFRFVDATPHRSFGKDLVGQTWAMDL